MNDIVHYLNINELMKINQEEFEILRKVSKNPKASQRELSSNLNISLGKINFVLNELKNKGLIKIQNFKQNHPNLTFWTKLKNGTEVPSAWTNPKMIKKHEKNVFV